MSGMSGSVHPLLVLSVGPSSEESRSVWEPRRLRRCLADGPWPAMDEASSTTTWGDVEQYEVFSGSWNSILAMSSVHSSLPVQDEEGKEVRGESGHSCGRG